MHDARRIGIQCSVVKLADQSTRIIERFVSIRRANGRITEASPVCHSLGLDLIDVLWILDTDGFRQVSKDVRVVDVQDLRAEVFQYPGKDRILIEIVVGSPGHCVEHHQIVEIRDLARDPLYGYFGLSEGLLRRDDRDKARGNASHRRQFQCDERLIDFSTYLPVEVQEKISLVDEEKLQSCWTQIVST